MMELEELIREYEEGIALEMYHEMVDYIDNHGADITGRNVDYTLMKVISMVRASAYMPEGCKKQVFLQHFSEKLISAVFRKGGSAFLVVFCFMSIKVRVVAVATATTLTCA